MCFSEVKKTNNCGVSYHKSLMARRPRKITKRWVNNKREYEEQLNNVNSQQNFEQPTLPLKFSAITSSQTQDPSQDI